MPYMYKPCAVTGARPISGNGTRGDLGDGEWQVAEGEQLPMRGQGEADTGGPVVFSNAVVRLITLITRRCWIYTSTFIIIVSNLAPCIRPFPRPSPPFFLPCTRTHSLQSYLIPSTILLSIHTSLSPFYLFSVPHPPQNPPLASAPPPILAEPANNQTASFSSTQANTYFSLRSSLRLIQPLWPFL